MRVRERERVCACLIARSAFAARRVWWWQGTRSSAPTPTPTPLGCHADTPHTRANTLKRHDRADHPGTPHVDGTSPRGDTRAHSTILPTLAIEALVAAGLFAGWPVLGKFAIVLVEIDLGVLPDGDFANQFKVEVDVAVRRAGACDERGRGRATTWRGQSGKREPRVCARARAREEG